MNALKKLGIKRPVAVKVEPSLDDACYTTKVRTYCPGTVSSCCHVAVCIGVISSLLMMHVKTMHSTGCVAAGFYIRTVVNNGWIMLEII